jgi:hypothetical protein
MKTSEIAGRMHKILAVALEFDKAVAWLAGMMVRSDPLGEGHQPC